MNGKLKIDPATQRIIMDRTFAKFYCDTTSEEYAHLQRVRVDYPNFSVVRRRIKKNTQQEHYAGLDYAYMEDYIRIYDKENAAEVLKEFEKLKFVSKCHSRHRRYPGIRTWFLAKYPEVDDLFKQKKQEEEKKQDQKQEDQKEPEYEDMLPPLSVVDGELSEKRA